MAFNQKKPPPFSIHTLLLSVFVCFDKVLSTCLHWLQADRSQGSLFTQSVKDGKFVPLFHLAVTYKRYELGSGRQLLFCLWADSGDSQIEVCVKGRAGTLGQTLTLLCYMSHLWLWNEGTLCKITHLGGNMPACLVQCKQAKGAQ